MISDTFWRNRRVFITGHTGFKGSWLVHWLTSLGSRVSGYALPPDQQPSLFNLSHAGHDMERSHFGDIRDAVSLASALRAAEPELVIHLAAQPLVRRSYVVPSDTWAVNVMGTVNVLEAARICPSVKGILAVTTDKCYENNNWVWGYRETDGLGGHDPYSASKAAAELAIQSYRRSFMQSSGPLLASARAGNVIGGGDWSDDRLIPDAARAIAAGTPLVVRNPDATRPWQHILDCLSGYLTLSQALLEGRRETASAYNFGPKQSGNLAVGDVLARLKIHWPELEWRVEADAAALGPHEAAFLFLDTSKANMELKWRTRWNVDDALRATAVWYRAVLRDNQDARALTQRQITEYSSHE